MAFVAGQKDDRLPVLRGLFSRFGVSGLVNVDLTPDFAAKLGAAYGAILPKGSTVCLNRMLGKPRVVKATVAASSSTDGNPAPATTAQVSASVDPQAEIAALKDYIDLQKKQMEELFAYKVAKQA